LLFGGVAIALLGVGVWILFQGRGDTVPTALILSIFALLFLILAAGVRGPSFLFADGQYVGKSGWFYNRQIVRRVPRSSVCAMRVRRNPVLPSLDFLGSDGRVVFSHSASFTPREIQQFADYLGVAVEGLHGKRVA
jgi:hypothetical protein